MMKNIKLLDCTLRDGGYVNDWEFGNDNIINIFERLVTANIDIIEVGFLDERRLFDLNRTIMPNCDAVNTIFAGLEKGNSLIVGMIDYGTCDIEHIIQCDSCFLDGVRVIFKKNFMHQAIEFCGKIKNLGYKVFVQAVSITSYSDDEMMVLLELVNELEPYAFSIVDTYGLLHKQNLVRYFNLANKHLKYFIGLGYHSHNNFQLAYSNCVKLLENPPNNRMFLVDGSLYGIGKSAGNAPIELLVMYMNEHMKKNYNLSQILEAIDVTIMEIYRKAPWGYSFKFFIAASNSCHPSYVMYLMDKKTLSIKSINEILIEIDDEKKLLYDKTYIEHLYLEYQKEDCNDEEDLLILKETFRNKRILLLGSGNTVLTENKIVQNYIDDFSPVVIAVNFLPDYAVNYIFISNSRRYVQLSSKISKLDEQIKLIATSNVTKSKGKFDFTLEYSALLDEKAQFVDNPMIMLIKLLDYCGVEDIALAGFDGYSKARTSDYVNPNMEYSFTKEKAIEINSDAISSLKRLGETVPLRFITKTYYAIDSNH
jgi:4-hydroxy 2-oxovalerate aldolase